MFTISDDPVRDFESWDAEQNRWLEKLPVCCRCDRPIQGEHLWDVDGDLYCEECAEDEFKKRTEDYIS